MSKNTQNLLSLLSKIFEVEVEAINDDTSPENTSKWDSFNTLRMIMELENVFEIKLPLEEVVTIKSVKDIKKLLSDKGIAF